MNTAAVLKCAHCGRPIGGLQTWLGGYAYHYECTLSPDSRQLRYEPMTVTPCAIPVPPLTESDVRRIVREELAKEKPNE